MDQAQGQQPPVRPRPLLIVETNPCPEEGEEEKSNSDSSGNTSDDTTSDEEGSPTTTAVFMPDKPRMGGRIQSRYNEWVPWTGGKPKPKWAGLDDNAETTPLRGLQIRTHTDKKYTERVTGLTEEYDKKTGDFARLQDDLVKHLEMHGMDTIAYLANPSNSSEMLHIVTEHPKFTNQKVRELMAAQLLLYDKYDKSNDACARDYLLDCLEHQFRREVEEQSRDAQSFPELFMAHVRILTGDSREIVKGEMRSLVPQNYPGHDITLMTKDFAIKARSLTATGLYDHGLTATFLQNIILAQWPETPKFALLTLKQKVQEAVDHIRFLDKSVADKHMTTNKLLHTHVTDEANSKYHKRR